MGPDSTPAHPLLASPLVLSNPLVYAVRMTSPLLPATETLSAENTECALTATISFPQPETLQLTYHVRNNDTVPLYLLNQLWQDIRRNPATNQPQAEVPSNLVNIVARDEWVKISKAIPEIPFGLLVEVPYMPGMLRLEPGADFTQTITLPVPLRPYTTYESNLPDGPLVTRLLHFELGYLRGLAHVVEAATPLATTTGEAIFSTPHFPAKHQSVIAVGPFREALPVVSQPGSLSSRPRPASPDKWTPWS